MIKGSNQTRTDNIIKGCVGSACVDPVYMAEHGDANRINMGCSVGSCHNQLKKGLSLHNI